MEVLLGVYTPRHALFKVIMLMDIVENELKDRRELCTYNGEDLGIVASVIKIQNHIFFAFLNRK